MSVKRQARRREEREKNQPPIAEPKSSLKWWERKKGKGYGNFDFVASPVSCRSIDRRIKATISKRVQDLYSK